MDATPAMRQYAEMKERYPDHMPANIPLLEQMARPVTMPVMKNAG